MSFDLFYGETIGASHIKKNTPKEDSGLTYETDKYKIFAVADGHGDPNCCRSELGSRFCCESAKEKLVPFMENINADDLFKTGIQFNIVNHLFSSILYSWTTKVNEHYENNPFTEDELNSLDPSFKSMYLKGNRIEHIYGTTLIVGILTDKFLLLIQQGDSHCFMINAKGEFFVPIPGDANCIGNVTTSMCDKDAHEAFRYTVVELDKFDLAACFLATDGFEDCYGAHFNRTAAGVAELINVANERGIIGLESYLDKRLPEMTATGSADDITVTGVIDLEKTRPLTNVFENMVRSIDLNFEIRAKEKKIADRVNKMNFLTNRYNNTKTEYDRVVKTLEKHKILLEKYKQDKENLKERIFVKEEEVKEVNFFDALVNRCRSFLSTDSSKVLESAIERLGKDIDRNIKESEAIVNEYTVKYNKLSIDKDKYEKEYLEYKAVGEKIDEELKSCKEELASLGVNVNPIEEGYFAYDEELVKKANEARKKQNKVEKVVEEVKVEEPVLKETTETEVNEEVNEINEDSKEESTEENNTENTNNDNDVEVEEPKVEEPRTEKTEE